MELRAYAAVLRRHARLIGLITLATLIASTALALRGPAAYTAARRARSRTASRTRCPRPWRPPSRSLT